MIVAEGVAKWGGKRCTECHAEIPVGARIFKVPAEGKTTHHGQGPGRWIGTCCYGKFVEQSSLNLEEA